MAWPTGDPVSYGGGGEREMCSATSRIIGVAATETWWYYGFNLRRAQQSTIANNDKWESNFGAVPGRW